MRNYTQEENRVNADTIKTLTQHSDGLQLTWNGSVRTATSAHASCGGEVSECNTRRRLYHRCGIYIWISHRPMCILIKQALAHQCHMDLNRLHPSCQTLLWTNKPHELSSGGSSWFGKCDRSKNTPPLCSGTHSPHCEPLCASGDLADF